VATEDELIAELREIRRAIYVLAAVGLVTGGAETEPAPAIETLRQVLSVVSPEFPDSAGR